MERKITSIPLEADVELYDWGAPIGRFKTKEIGFNSINVFTGRAQIDKHLVVEMLLVLKSALDKPFRMKGLVTYQAKETARIVFFHYYPEYFEVLSKLISRIRGSKIVLPYPLEPAITNPGPFALPSAITAPRLASSAGRTGFKTPSRSRSPVSHP